MNFVLQIGFAGRSRRRSVRFKTMNFTFEMMNFAFIQNVEFCVGPYLTPTGRIVCVASTLSGPDYYRIIIGLLYCIIIGLLYCIIIGLL